MGQEISALLTCSWQDFYTEYCQENDWACKRKKDLKARMGTAAKDQKVFPSISEDRHKYHDQKRLVPSIVSKPIWLRLSAFPSLPASRRAIPSEKMRCTLHWVNQSNSHNQSIGRSIDQSIKQATDQIKSIKSNQSINQSINKSTNQSINQPINSTFNQSIIINQSMSDNIAALFSCTHFELSLVNWKHLGSQIVLPWLVALCRWNAPRMLTFLFNSLLRLGTRCLRIQNWRTDSLIQHC